jgi:putative ABC transport system permease protein
MSRLRIFYRLILRPICREPLRSSLILVAVALGVAVVLAIELAGDAAAGSFRSSVATLTGNYDLEVTGTGGVPDDIVGKLATLPYNVSLHPRIEDYATLPDTGETVPVLGLDLVSDHPSNLTSARSSDLQFLQEEGVWVSKHLSEYLRLKIGGTLRLQLNDASRIFKVLGIFDDSQNHDDLIVMDIAIAQRVLARDNRVDRILISLPRSPAIDTWEQKLRAALPSGVELRREGAQKKEHQRLLSAFRGNLRVLSYVALVVGAFLIYNTISVSVVRRRPEIGIIRSLGASRKDVLLAFLAEAACFGLIGGGIGIILGRLMALGAVRPIAATVTSLYVTSSPAPIELSPGTIFLGFFVGISVSLISAAAPAREAALVSPVEAMARARRDYIAGVRKMRDLWIASGLALTGLAASYAPAIDGRPLLGYLAALLFIAAATFSIPALVAGVSVVSYQLLRRLLGVEALLAARSLAASLRRTSVLVGALATAIAMTTAVGIMVGSFRQTVAIWLDDQLKADLFLRPAGNPGSDRHPKMDPSLADKIAGLPQVAEVDRFRGYDLSYEGLPATLGSVDTRGNHEQGRIRYLSGKTDAEIDQQLRQANNAVISEPFANKHHLRAGDTIELPLGQALIPFHIVDVYYDYANEKGYIIVDRSILLRYLPDPAPSNIAIYLKPGVNLNDAKDAVQKVISGHSLWISTNQSIRTEGLRIFDRTFAITYALEIVAILVAIMGIAGALLALVIDRRREFGLLRFLGASVAQVRKIVLIEAGLIGLLANIAGIALGIILSLLLVYVINKQSFGWTIQFHWPVAILLAALSVVYLATILAGFYPARIATRLNPIEVVHEE